MLQREWDSEPFSDELISSSFDGAESFNKALGSNILLKRGQTQPPYQAQIKKSRNSLRFAQRDVTDGSKGYSGDNSGLPGTTPQYRGTRPASQEQEQDSTMTDQLHEEAESGKETLENTWHHDLEKPYEEEQDHQPNAEDQHPYEEDQQPYEEEQQPYDEGQPNAEDQQPYEDDQPNAEDQHPYEEDQQPYEEDQPNAEDHQPCKDGQPNAEDQQPYEEDQPNAEDHQLYEEDQPDQPNADQQLYGEDQPNAEDHQPYGDEYQQPCEVVEEDEPEQPNEGDRKYEEVPYRGDPGVEFTHETVLRQPGTAASRARSLGPRERIPLVRGKVDAIRNMFESEPDASSPTSEPSQGAVRFDSGAVGCGNAALMPLSHLSEHVEADSAVVDPHHGPVLVVDPQQHYYFHGDENLDETEGHLQPVGLETSSQFYDPLYLDTGDDDSVSVVLKTPEEQPHFPDKPNTAPRASDASDRNALSIRSSPFVETLKAEPINADPIDTVAVDAPNPLHQLFMPVERVQPVSSSGTLQYSPTSDRDLAVSPTLLPKVRQRGAGELNDESKGLPRLSSPVSWPQVPYGAGMIPRQQPTPPAKPRYRKSVHELGGNQNRQPPHGEQSARGARVNEGDRVPQREQSALRGARVGEGELVPLREQPALRGTRANEGDRVPQREQSALRGARVDEGELVPLREQPALRGTRVNEGDRVPQREQSALRGARVDEGELARAQPAPRGSRVNEGDRVPQREQMSVGGAQNFKTTGQPVQKDRWEPRGVDTLKTDRQTSTMDKNAASKERLANPAARPTSGRGGSVERSVQTELTAEDLQAMRSGPTAKEPVRDLATRFAPRGDILFEDAQGNQAVANSGDRSAVSISDLLEQALNTKNPEVVNLRASFARRPSPLAARFVPPIRRESPQPTRHPDHTVVKHALPPQAALGKENVSDEESVRLRHTTQPNVPIFQRPSEVWRHHAPTPRHAPHGPSPRHAYPDPPSPRHASQGPSPRHISLEPPPMHASQGPSPRRASQEPPSPRHASQEPPSPRHASQEPPSPRHAAQEPPSPRHASAPRHCVGPPAPVKPLKSFPPAPLPGELHRQPNHKRHSREEPESAARRKSPGGRRYRPSFETFSPRGVVRRNGDVATPADPKESEERKRQRKHERANIRADRESRRENRDRKPRVDIVVSRVRREP